MIPNPRIQIQRSFDGGIGGSISYGQSLILDYVLRSFLYVEYTVRYLKLGTRRNSHIAHKLVYVSLSSLSTDDYLRYNPTHHVGYLLLWVLQSVLLLFVQILATGRLSLLFTMIIIGIAYTFTDSSNLKWRTHLGWSMAHAMAHISSALICLLFVECMAEFVVSEGLVETQTYVDGDANAQSCGTGLATSIFDEYNTHFSHALEDFQLLNTTNSTDPPNLLPSCRFDEYVYEMVSSTFSWLYHEAPFLKTTLAVFDLPGVIGRCY